MASICVPAIHAHLLGAYHTVYPPSMATTLPVM